MMYLFITYVIFIPPSPLYLTGRVFSGMAIVKRIGLVETDKNDRPVDDVKIVKGSIKNA